MIEQHRVGSKGTAATGGRERFGVIALALGVIGLVALYLVLGPRRSSDQSRDLLPYQALVATLPDADQQLFSTLRSTLLVAEETRAKSGAWPEPETLAARGLAPFAEGSVAGNYRWSRLQQAAIVNYLGVPADPALPAWLLEIQEPEPGMLPDTAPPDDEHHLLPDGTMLHIYVWMHSYGAQVPVGFIRQPQSSGWMEDFSKPPDPVYYNRR
ncbi:MAG: hypothetical protein QM736_13400 [Vicinamibacterales bacterium]